MGGAKPTRMYFNGDVNGQSDATSMSCNIVTKHRENGKTFFRLNRVAHYHHSGAETGQVKAMSTYAVERSFSGVLVSINALYRCLD